jgi:anti-anti-sigma factor
LELFQLQNDEGPCLDAFRSGTPVVHPDLREDTQRWPRFAPHATAAGFRSVHAFPLRLRAKVIGALNVFGADEGGRLDAEDVPIVQALADTASIALLQERTIRQAHVLTEQLQGALNSRIVIEQAKGAVAQSRGVSVDEAFALIRAYARSNSRRLGEVARALVANIDNIPTLTRPDRRPGSGAGPGPSETSASVGRQGPARIGEPSTDAAATYLRIHRRLLPDGGLTLDVSGEVDMDSYGRLEAAIQDALAEPDVTTLLVDLDRVTFLDSSGIRTLLNGHTGAGERGVAFRVVNPTDIVRRVLDITGVLDMLTDGTWPDLPDTPQAHSA